MSSDKQRGRADAAKRSYNPPREPLFGLLSTTRQVEKTATRKGYYDEGYNDKKQEMKKRR